MEVRIKDKRGGRFIVDDVVLNGYGKVLGPYGIAAYVALCRHANMSDQKCWPSQATIASETGMSVPQVKRELDKIDKLKLVRREIVEGRYTVYTLLEPKKKHLNDKDVEKYREEFRVNKTSTRTPINVIPLSRRLSTPITLIPKGTNRTNEIISNGSAVGEKNMKGTESLGDLLKGKVIIKKKGGASYEWQDKAVRVADKLGVKVSPKWFKCFRDTPHGVLESAYRYVSDYPSAGDKEKLFYWSVNNFKKHGRIPAYVA